MKKNLRYGIQSIVSAILAIICTVIGLETTNLIFVPVVLLLILFAGFFLCDVRDDRGKAEEYKNIPDETYELVYNVVDRVYVLKQAGTGNYFTVTFLPSIHLPIGSIILKIGETVVLVK